MNAPSFSDHFSGHADLYRRFRPTYPDVLYGWLGDLVEGDGRRRRAWDCATGNGQAAVGLGSVVDRVTGTDASTEQLRHARRHPRVEYVAALAERSPFRDATVDLVTVAQAVHWFHLDAFWGEVRRVARPGGVIAAWTYELFSVDAAVDAVIRWFYSEVVGPHWPPERRWVEEGYRTLPFPFDEITDVPDFVMRPRWRRADVLGQISTWSAVRRYRDRRASDTPEGRPPASGREPPSDPRPAVTHDPLRRLEGPLTEAWPDGEEERAVTWPLRLRVGRI